MDAGDMFTDMTSAAAIKSCVIGTTIVRELFPDESPIGKDIRVQNVSLRVVGVLGPKGANMMGMDQDDIVLAPWTTIKFRVSGNNSGGASGGAAATAAASTGSISTDTKTLNNIYPGTVGALPAAIEHPGAEQSATGHVYQCRSDSHQGSLRRGNSQRHRANYRSASRTTSHSR